MRRGFSITMLVSAAGLIAVSACGRDSQPPAMSPASRVAPAHTPEAAVDAIANASCDREFRCNNIGEGREFQNRDHCLTIARNDATEELTEDSDCRRGIKPEDLNECLSQLREQSCGAVAGVFEGLSATVSCRSAELCMD